MADPSREDVIASQTTHALGITYGTLVGDSKLASNFEVQNVTDERVFDLFDVRGPEVATT